MKTSGTSTDRVLQDFQSFEASQRTFSQMLVGRAAREPETVAFTSFQRAVQSSVLAFAAALPDIGYARHVSVSFLGLSHVAPALVNVFVPIMTKLEVTFCTMEQRLAALGAVRPTAIVRTPRMYEKLAGELLAELAKSGPLVRARYAAAMTLALAVWARRSSRQPARWWGVSEEAEAVPAQEQHAALQRRISEVNAELSRPLQLKNFRVLPRALSADLGELTLKTTIRRGNILDSFADQVDEMYEGHERRQISGHARLPRHSHG